MRAAKNLATLALFSLASLPALAHWTLDPEQSTLSYISVKNDTIAEVNRFESFSADINDSGAVNISVDLASVNTNIDIRDQRLRDILFTTTDFPQANISAQLDADAIANLKKNTPQNIDIDLLVELHGESKTLPAQLSVTKFDEHTLLVATRAPVLLNAADFALLEGLNELQSIAGLNSIQPIVPITGVWTFTLEH